jgi:hypothetical protein
LGFFRFFAGYTGKSPSGVGFRGLRLREGKQVSLAESAHALSAEERMRSGAKWQKVKALRRENHSLHR